MSDGKVRDALADVINNTNGWESARMTADRLLSSDVLATIRADAWDDGYQRGLRDEIAEVQHEADNPYRTEAT